MSNAMPQSGGLERPPHLDELTAMRLADGEAVAPAVADHATGCAVCAALVAAFRVESRALSEALTLEDAELTWLTRARVPSQVAAVATGRAQFTFLHVPRDTPASLLAMLMVAVTMYAIWWYTNPLLVLDAGLQLARRSGLVTIVVQYLAGWLFGWVWALGDILRVIEQLPAIDTPALPLAAVALLTWLALGLMPLSRPNATQQA